MNLVKSILRSRRGWKLMLTLSAIYVVTVLVYYHLPWSIRMPVYKAAPQVDRSLRKSGYRLLSGWDELALVGRDAAVEVEPGYRGDRVYGGYPSQGFKVVGRLKRLENRGYAAGYSDARRNPLWVSYRIFDVPKLVYNKKRPRFKVDERTRSEVRHADYTHSGFDRGHMAPNYGIATRYGRAAQLETFLMSNVIPQNPNVNRHLWKDLEMRVAKRYGRYFGEVWVITGPVFEEPIRKLKSGVSIPSHYYKIIVDEQGGRLRALAFLVEKDLPPYTRVRKRMVSIDRLEELTGLDFFAQLPNDAEDALESQPATRLWPWLRAAFRYKFKPR